MKYAVFTVGLPEHTPEQAVATLRELGYDGWVSFEDFSIAQPLLERLRDNSAFVKRTNN